MSSYVVELFVRCVGCFLIGSGLGHLGMWLVGGSDLSKPVWTFVFVGLFVLAMIFCWSWSRIVDVAFSRRKKDV